MRQAKWSKVHLECTIQINYDKAISIAGGGGGGGGGAG